MDIPHDLWTKNYLTYTQQIVGFCAPDSDMAKLIHARDWLSDSQTVIRAYLALISPRLFIQKATAIQADDIFSIPYPEKNGLDLSINEQILVDDIVTYYRDLIRRGEDSTAMTQSGHAVLSQFNDVFVAQINAVYRKKPLRSLSAQAWPGVICQPFVFGEGSVDWNGADELKDKISGLLYDKHRQNVHVTRIGRIYDGSFVFLLKPERLRYWLRSIALRDADEVLADLRVQGF